MRIALTVDRVEIAHIEHDAVPRRNEQVKVWLLRENEKGDFEPFCATFNVYHVCHVERNLLNTHFLPGTSHYSISVGRQHEEQPVVRLEVVPMDDISETYANKVIEAVRRKK